jgi:hypothetical protein
VRLTALTALAAALLITPSAASGYIWEPPSWFKAGVALVNARGGTCEPSGSTFHLPDNSGGPGETVVSKGEDCSHRIPKVLAKKFGVNPARGETCAGIAYDVTGQPTPGITPTPENYLYGCRVFARPGTNAKPNRASWPCSRSIYGGDGGSHNDRRWIAERTKLYRKQTFKTLKQCLSRRLRAKR